MKNKSLIAASVLVGSIIVAGTAHAAASNGSLQFSWQGTTPAAQITPTGWSFQDPQTTQTFVPTTTALNFQTDSSGVLSISSVSPINFNIVPSGGTLNSINAYLGSAPVSNGFVGSKQLALASTVTPNNNEVAIILNNQPLKVGSGNVTNIATGSNSSSQAVSISLAAKVAAADFRPSAVVGFSVPVLFSVDVGA